MCIPGTPHAYYPSAHLKPPTLQFTEPSLIIPAVGDDPGAIIKGATYQVGCDTLLGPTEAFRRIPVSDPSTYTEKQRKWSTLYQDGHEPDIEYCKNIDYVDLDSSDSWDSSRPPRSDTDLVGPKFGRSWLTGSDPKSWGFDKAKKCKGEEVFAHFFTFAFNTRLVPCDAPACRARKAALAASAPSCEWHGFRDFILTLMACWIIPCIHECRNRDKNTFEAIFPCVIPEVLYIDHVPTLYCLDVAHMLELWLWASQVVHGGGLAHTLTDGFWRLEEDDNIDSFERVWSTLTHAYEASALHLATKCRQYGICQTRLWNIASQGLYGTSDITHVANLVLDVANLFDTPLLASGKEQEHRECTAQYCVCSNTNSTVVKQAHKCAPHDRCKAMEFPAGILDDTYRQSTEWCNTAWRITRERQESRDGRLDLSLEYSRPPSFWLREKELCSSKEEYMAISHVWADGTGVGLKKPGHVNSCLVAYFEDIAMGLGCSGIWWDTISLPIETKAVAMKNMLQNYENAKVTLVHDNDLMNFQWRSDGSPAAAVLLSSWFSRGWTAAELYASRQHPVVFVFANPDTSSDAPKYVLKDLDDDVLAQDRGPLLNVNDPSPCPRNPPGLGHLVATDIISIFRDGERDRGMRSWHHHDVIEGSLAEMWRVLRPRTTSWAKDRILIAGLMCLSPDKIGTNITDLTEHEITQQLLTNMRWILTRDLIHWALPIATQEPGPWDWCPQSVFDLGLLRDPLNPPAHECEVTGNGQLEGYFEFSLLTPNDRIVPYGSHVHPALKARVATAQTRTCLLLEADKNRPEHRTVYFLFQPLFFNLHTRRFRGSFVASVVCVDEPHKDRVRNVDDLISWSGRTEFQFGSGEIPPNESEIAIKTFRDLQTAIRSIWLAKRYYDSDRESLGGRHYPL